MDKTDTSLDPRHCLVRGMRSSNDDGTLLFLYFDMTHSFLDLMRVVVRELRRASD